MVYLVHFSEYYDWALCLSGASHEIHINVLQILLLYVATIYPNPLGANMNDANEMFLTPRCIESYHEMLAKVAWRIVFDYL